MVSGGTLSACRPCRVPRRAMRVSLASVMNLRILREEPMMFPSGRIGQSMLVCAYLLLILLCAGASQAQDSSRFQIGSSNTVTADPAVPRPHHKPCVVQLYSNFSVCELRRPQLSVQPRSMSGPV